MSAAKHTPGPWVARFGPLLWSVHQVGAEKTTICSAPAGDESEANARLIAAAPELLSLLLEALNESSLDIVLGTAWWDRTCAAIDKATRSAP